jgi:hypothetical protein
MSPPGYPSVLEADFGRSGKFFWTKYQTITKNRANQSNQVFRPESSPHVTPGGHPAGGLLSTAALFWASERQFHIQAFPLVCSWLGREVFVAGDGDTSMDEQRFQQPTNALGQSRSQ